MVEIKGSETIKVIIDIYDDKLIKRKIEDISNCNKSYFDRILYRDYVVRIKEFDINELEYK